MTREEAIGALEDIRDAICDNIPGNHAELDELRDAVRMATEALKERKTGKWLFPYGDKKYKRCSVCERDYYSIPHNSNYCPNCGADMRKTT